MPGLRQSAFGALSRTVRTGFVIATIFFVWSTQIAVAMDAELDGYCVTGLAEGQRIKTDCEVTWTSPDGKKYCFRTEDARAVFLKDPDTYLQKAKEHFALSEKSGKADDMGRYVSSQVKEFVREYIKAESDKNGGLFPVKDTLHARTLKLKFEKIDFMRTLHGYGFFPNTVFSDKENPDKKYQIDFWVKPRGGKLRVVDIRIYKAPRREGKRWIQMTRQPKPWWWIPASEHPGESEIKRGWEIMSALHGHIADVRKKNNGVYTVVDDKTGKKVEMEFVGIHQPVRRLKEDGRFFACTDFRRVGTKNEYYDVDFWLDDSTGEVKVGKVRLHKVPIERDGNMIQMERYEFDPKTYEVVP